VRNNQDREVETDASVEATRRGNLVQLAGARSVRPSALVGFFTFQDMIAPVILQCVFWLGALTSLLVGASFLISSWQAGPSGILGVLYGFAVLVGGPITLRIACELLIVPFRIYETLNGIKDRLDRRA